MTTYNRVFSHINNSRSDCMARASKINYENHKAIILVLIEIAVYKLNEAITRMERKYE